MNKLITSIFGAAKPVAELALKIIGMFSKTKQERLQKKLDKLVKDHNKAMNRGRPK